MSQTVSLEAQADALFQSVRALPSSYCTPQKLLEIIDMTREIPEQFITPAFLLLLSTRFSVDLPDVTKQVMDGGSILNIDFDMLVPQSGWLHEYVRYTRNTEPPTAFHFFAGITVLGATIARRRYFPRGSGDIFPNISCVLVAPPGKCKKTTACNLAVNLFRRIGGNLMADKITPEAIVDSFSSQASATGLIYAPEWSVFLGKQQYMEGLVPMLTALFDCPEIWTSTTIMRGTAQLQNVALSHLAATTIDWMQTSITTDAFAGGFMSRLLFIVQRETPRKFALPPPLDKNLQKWLVEGLMDLQQTVGEVEMTPEARIWYQNWYDARNSSSTEKHFAGYYERKPDRLIQLAMVMSAAKDPKSLLVDRRTLEDAEAILKWIERYLPSAFEELSQSIVGDDQLRLLKQLRNHKGELDAAQWLRMNTSRMGDDSFRKYTATLRAAKMIAYDFARKRFYLLRAGKAVE